MINLFDFMDNETPAAAAPKDLGLIPDGSYVKVQLSVKPKKWGDPDNQICKTTKSGLRRLMVDAKVLSGTYAGVWIHDNILLPPNQQSIQLTTSQATACSIGGKLLAMLWGGHLPPDAPHSAYVLDRWEDLDGISLVAKIKIDNFGNKESNRLANGVLPYAPIVGEVERKGEVLGKSRPADDVTFNPSAYGI